jgi:hypothetical protein
MLDVAFIGQKGKKKYWSFQYQTTISALCDIQHLIWFNKAIFKLMKYQMWTRQKIKELQYFPYAIDTLKAPSSVLEFA